MWDEMSAVTSTERGVEIILKKSGKRMLGLVSSSEAIRKVILISQKSKRDKLADVMESLRVES